MSYRSIPIIPNFIDLKNKAIQFFMHWLSFSASAKNNETTCFYGISHFSFHNHIRHLSPGYFSLVMASGIVSLAAHIYGFNMVAHGLLYFNIVAYLWLLVLFIARLFLYWNLCKADFYNLDISPGHLAFVAGSAVLGVQFVRFWDHYYLAVLMYVLSSVAWLFLIYAFFTVITVAHEKPKFSKSISGSWLLIIVSTQSIAVLGIQVAHHFNIYVEPILFCSLILFLCGCMFYIFIITLIVYRMSFFDLLAKEFAPSYWINMGATAISVLAGSHLITNADKWFFLQDILPFLKGFTLLYWAIGTWWIPFVVIMGIWRTVLKQFPLKYHPLYWSMVFPLGMYTVCTYKMAQALQLSFLKELSEVFVYIALGSWIITFVGMVVYYLRHPFFKDDSLPLQD